MAGALLLCATLALMVIGADGWRHIRGAPAQAELTAALDAVEPDVSALYVTRDKRPIWLGDPASLRAAHVLVARIAQADGDALDPATYGLKALIAGLADVPKLSRADQLRLDAALTEAAVRFVSDLHTPFPEARMVVTHARALETFDRRAVLRELATTQNLEATLAELTTMHPVYDALRQAALDRRGRNATSQAPGAKSDDVWLGANLDRARGLPAAPSRHILVDVASARLWLYEEGQVVDTMPVVVGRTDLPTPMLAGLISHAVVNPYWNVPPDLVRDRLAPRAIRAGPSALEAENFEVLSDWTPTASPISATEIDWVAVRDERLKVRVRQRPGPDNLLGRVKFMLPNRLGIYLHDTPDKAAFERSDRRLSAGCIRVADAGRLAAWLFGRPIDLSPPTPAETRIDLPDPTPVYVTYLTADISRGAVSRGPDPYRLDPPIASVVQTASHPSRSWTEEARSRSSPML